MLRFVRPRTLRALQAARAELAVTKEDLAAAQAAARSASDNAGRATALAKRQLRDLAEAHAALIQAQRDRDAARTERDQARADARKEAQQQLAELGEDYARLRDAAADTETGETVRAALAYHVLRDLIADARARGQELGQPFDVLAMILGFDEPDPNTRNADA